MRSSLSGLAVCILLLLSLTDFGRYALGITVYNIVVLFAPFGMETAALKFVSQQARSDGMASVRKRIVTGAGVAAGFCVLLVLCLAFSSDLLARALFGNAELTTVLSLLALSAPRAAVSTVVRALVDAGPRAEPHEALIRNGLEPVGSFLLAGIAVSFGFGLAGPNRLRNGALRCSRATCARTLFWRGEH